MLRSWMIWGWTICTMTLWATSVSAAPIRYSVTFDATWSNATHPQAIPAGAHFSRLIGGTHSSSAQFWNSGILASPGIERMAELGSVSTLQTEVQTAIDAGMAGGVILGAGINSPGSTQTEFEVTPEFPLVSLVSMVAPSPDWFVGVHDLDLRNGDGWKELVVADLYVYDAGTDDGIDFTSADLEPTPHQSIGLLGSPFAASDPRLGTFTFRRLTTPEPATNLAAGLALVGMIAKCRSGRRSKQR